MNDSFQTRTVANVFDQLSVPIEIVDRAGTTCYVNQAFTRLTGYETKDAVTRDTTAMLRDDSASFVKLQGTVLAAISRIEECTKQDGAHFLCETSVQPIRAVGRVETEFYVILRREVEARPLSYDGENLSQDELDDIGHELRTPLNAIIGYAEMLLEDARAEGRNQLADDLDRIRRAGRQLQTAIGASLRHAARTLRKAHS